MKTNGTPLSKIIAEAPFRKLMGNDFFGVLAWLDHFPEINIGEIPEIGQVC